MKGERGLTLIETLVAVCVFSAAATAVTALSTTAFATADWNKDRAEALAIVQSEFEVFRALTFAELGEQAPLRFVTCAGRTCGVARTVALNRPAPGMAEVTIGVTFTGRRRGQYVAKTIITSVQR
ncbi:MAG: type IV pilus modification PilV family protein [Candidatus Binatia bacterium]